MCFVGVAPNYVDRDTYPVHKGGAIVAAIGCIGWCLSICWWVTFCIAMIYLICIMYVKTEAFANKMWHVLNGSTPKHHPWYWAEVAGFLDVFLTYWLCVC